MLRVGLLLHTFHADQQQALIAAVGQRMHGFRCHRTGTGHECRGELAGEDREIRAEREENRLA